MDTWESEGRSLRLVNAVTGGIIVSNPSFFLSYTDLVNFIALKWGGVIGGGKTVGKNFLVLLEFGHRLSAKNFTDFVRRDMDQVKELYVFDKRLFTVISNPDEETSGETQQKQCHQILETVNDTLTLVKPIKSPMIYTEKVDTLSLQEMTSVLTTNLGWLSALEIDVYYLEDTITGTLQQIKNILKCLYCCYQYLGLYGAEMEKLFKSSDKFYRTLQNDQKTINWKYCLDNVLGSLPSWDNDPPLSKFVNRSTLTDLELETVTIRHNIDTELKRAESDIQQGKSLGGTIMSKIDSTREQFLPSEDKYKLETNMLTNFKDLVERTRDISRDILDTQESTELDIGNVHSHFSNIRQNTVNDLYTISYSLYSQADNIHTLKKSLQANVIEILGQISFTQLKYLQVKRRLTTDCEKYLKNYQKNELQFAHVEDLPTIYGLYLIELYRRNVWLVNVNNQIIKFDASLEDILQDEQITRDKWTRIFGSITSIFIDQSFDLSIRERGISELRVKKSDTSTIDHNSLLSFIQGYITTFDQLNNNQDVIHALKKKLQETQSSITLQAPHAVITSPVEESQLIESYKLRIKKLENLLHESKYSNTSYWPSGMIEESSLTTGRNISQGKDNRLESKAPSLILNQNVADLERENAHFEEVASLRKELEQMRLEQVKKEKLIKVQNSKIVDMEIERNAFRETLNNLNTELERVMTNEGSLKVQLDDEKTRFSQHINALLEENRKLFIKNEQTEGELERFKSATLKEDKSISVLQKQNEELENKNTAFASQLDTLNLTNTSLLSDFNELTCANIDLKSNIDKLKTTNTNLGVEIEKLKAANDDLIETQKHVRTQDENEEANKLSSNGLSLKLEGSLFTVFKTCVFILENIGLLLTSNDNQKGSEPYSIKRVKGLRKGINQSVLEDESTQLLVVNEKDEVIQSKVYQEMRNNYEKALEQGQQTPVSYESITRFISVLDNLFGSKYYEQAVIKRFNDLESLAKKATKENKMNRGLIARLRNEKITLRNFQIHDLALFLPTTDIQNATSSSSSLNSSFSSVDLSTPTMPLSTTSTQQGQIEKKDKLAPSDSKESSKIDTKIRPWAAFTAFEDSTRYFLKKDENDDQLLSGKEWFIGRITSANKIIAGETMSNPYRLPKGSIWYQVTAKILSGPL
ncbi:autophagy protein ATG11 KNAG_0H00820 [Huiozyma naganishii CBS 8797]|uniref:Autophagy-related protein 11 n=1 Tax=Huiozyma naganishii (strain ATCC MYA-139 / BCRC 22969 / CBS 8797 / KCTC 17520 / NBRC 10181 / NCYC 3082 / Yp74L-3) TaxID=1071383 RepID=J7S1L3_HUIN7|nr:hypothetical protein KNAG_0H00820 [Kazachstania naganishii CBS 8797]CCK71497.1 hypothetical protein KNAG_0H00820 [Kazachstania naganishii CBS 8797]